MFEQEVNCLLVTFLGCSLSGINIVERSGSVQIGIAQKGISCLE